MAGSLTATEITTSNGTLLCPRLPCANTDKKCTYEPDPTLDANGCLANPCGVQTCGDSFSSTAIIALAAVGAAIVAALLLALSCYCFYYCCHREKRERKPCCHREKRERKPAPYNPNPNPNPNPNQARAWHGSTSQAISSRPPQCPICLRPLLNPHNSPTVVCCGHVLPWPGGGRSEAHMRLQHDEKRLLRLMRGKKHSAVTPVTATSTHRPSKTTAIAPTGGNNSRIEQAFLAALGYSIADISRRSLRFPTDMSTRTFASSNFKRVYPGTPKVQYQHVLIQAVRGLVSSVSARKKISKAVADKFFDTLQAVAFRNTAALQKDVSSACEFLWTSAERLRGLEFCSIINLALREDDPLDIVHVSVISRCLNSRRVMRTNPVHHQRGVPLFPPRGRCYRGTGWRDQHRQFFEKNLHKKYRVAGFLATSVSRDVAKSFLYRVSKGQPRVLWTVKFDPRGEQQPEFRVKHMSFVAKTLIPGEGEFLFAPYSVFTVLDVKWSSSRDKYHKISLQAAIDNIKESEHLPLAPWY